MLRVVYLVTQPGRTREGRVYWQPGFPLLGLEERALEERANKTYRLGSPDLPIEPLNEQTLIKAGKVDSLFGAWKIIIYHPYNNTVSFCTSSRFPQPPGGKACTSKLMSTYAE